MFQNRCIYLFTFISIKVFKIYICIFFTSINRFIEFGLTSKLTTEKYDFNEISLSFYWLYLFYHWIFPVNSHRWLVVTLIDWLVQRVASMRATVMKILSIYYLCLTEVKCGWICFSGNYLGFPHIQHHYKHHCTCGMVCSSFHRFHVFSNRDDAANSIDQPVFISASSHWKRGAKPKL